MVKQSEGYFDAHCHLDRANTGEDIYFSHKNVGADFYREAPLSVKQDATGDLHEGPAYETEEVLYERMKKVVLAKIAGGETRLNAIVDCSPDIDGRAFRMALKLREEFQDQIEINVGAYPIFGFKTFGWIRQTHLEELASQAQFLVGLPERDARDDPDNNVGFDGHLAILFDLSLKIGRDQKKKPLPIQVHVDQTGRSDEHGTEDLVEAVRWNFTSRLPLEDRPKVSAVHVISPNFYSQDRRWDLIGGLKRNNIDVVCCPRAALSMRQNPSHEGPMRNSIAPVKELLVAGVNVSFGTDNINDMFMPLPKSPLLTREIGEEHGVIFDAIRFYDAAVIDKLARGKRLNQVDRLRVEESLKGDYAAAGWYGHRPWRKIK
jgi:cytosine deaminase